MRRVNVTYQGLLPDGILLERLKKLPQALCVVNTTRHAARLARALVSDDSYHLSARMCPVHRSGVLAMIRARLAAGLPCKVISTQVIECGVDIDFPIVYRAMCGLDSLAQSAGRCNREGRLAQRGEVIFFRPEKPIPNMLAAQAHATAQILPDHLGDPLALDAVQHFFLQYYWTRGDYDRQEILPALTGHGVAQFQFEQAAAFALIDSPTRPVIIPWGAPGDKLCRHLRRPDIVDRPALLRRLAQRAQHYSVNVYPDELETLIAAETVELVHENFFILADASFYSPTVGLLRQGASGEVTNEIG